MKKNLAVLVLVMVGLTVYGAARTPVRPSAQIAAPAGTYNDTHSVNTEQPRCNPNYSGCLKPDASDYDCIGGSGNGPYYTGRVRVIGYDEYGLDGDGDGWGCE